MDRKESSSLKIGDRIIIWPESPDACTGTVSDVGYHAVRFVWDDTGKHSIIHKNDMKDVARYYGSEPIIPVNDKHPAD